MIAEQPVVFLSDSQQVVGMWHEPVRTHEQAAPAVVFLHGFTGHKAESHRLFVETARALAAQGIGALRFDFRGSGDSEGDFKDLTIMGEVADARAALAFARSRPGVDPARIGLLGLSIGGAVAPYVVADDPGLRAVVLWNPVACPGRSAERRRTPDSARQLQEWGFVDFNGWAVGAALMEELPTLDPVPVLARGSAPAFILLGSNDEVVPNEEGYMYQRAVESAGGTVCLEVIDGGDHTFACVPHKQIAIHKTVTWLTSVL
jgi:uncharacterized protein